MAVLCRGLEKNGVAKAGHGRGMASVNQTRPHCANQMGKTHSKPLAAQHGHGMLCVNRPLRFGDQQPSSQSLRKVHYHAGIKICSR